MAWNLTGNSTMAAESKSDETWTGGKVALLTAGALFTYGIAVVLCGIVVPQLRGHKKKDELPEVADADTDSREAHRLIPSHSL